MMYRMYIMMLSFKDEHLAAYALFGKKSILTVCEKLAAFLHTVATASKSKKVITEPSVTVTGGAVRRLSSLRQDQLQLSGNAIVSTRFKTAKQVDAERNLPNRL